VTKPDQDPTDDPTVPSPAEEARLLKHRRREDDPSHATDEEVFAAYQNGLIEVPEDDGWAPPELPDEGPPPKIEVSTDDLELRGKLHMAEERAGKAEAMLRGQTKHAASLEKRLQQAAEGLPFDREIPEDRLHLRAPPHDEDAERAVLGLYLSDAGLMDGFNQKYLHSMFYFPDHIKIHDAMMRLGARADTVTVFQELQKLGHAQLPATYLTELLEFSQQVSKAAITDHILIVEEHYLARSLIQWGNQVMRGVYSQERITPSEAEAVVKSERHAEHSGRLQEMDIPSRTMVDFIRALGTDLLAKLLPYRAQFRDDPLRGTEEVEERFEELRARDGKPEVDLGFSKLNSITYGCGLPLVVMGGHTKHAKSTFALNLCQNISRKGLTTLFLSYQLRPYEARQKLIAREAGVDSELFRYYEELPPEFEGKVRPAIETVKNTPLWVHRGQRDIEYIVHKITEMKRRFPDMPLVVLDELQSLPKYLPYQNNPSYVYGEYLETLRNLAADLNIMIWVNAELKSPTRGKEKKPSSCHDFAQCHELEQRADAVLGMWNPGVADQSKPTDKTEIVPLALRNKKAGGLNFHLGTDLATANFYEL
tara:strand:- start:591 stop:2372 length:1782 start_codon:yes stop_codon:yes gene_type:complete